MASVKKAKKILKRLGYKIIKSRGNGAFVVDSPNGERVTIFGYPRTDYRWLPHIKHYMASVYPDTSTHPSNRYRNDTSSP